MKGLSDTELGYILGVSADAARKTRNGNIKSLKLEPALRLSRRLGISPWYLAGEPEPPSATSPFASALVVQPGGKLRAQSTDAQLLQTAESALLLHDELLELQSRVADLEAALEERRLPQLTSREP